MKILCSEDSIKLNEKILMILKIFDILSGSEI